MPLVKLFAGLRKTAGLKQIAVAGANLAEVLSGLAQHNPALGAAILENGALRPHVVITLNGHPVDSQELAVTEQDEIAIFPPLAGG